MASADDGRFVSLGVTDRMKLFSTVSDTASTCFLHFLLTAGSLTVRLGLHHVTFTVSCKQPTTSTAAA